MSRGSLATQGGARYTECMKTKAGKYAWGVLVLTWVAAIASYGVMPEQMASHWNAAGVANGYTDKIWGLFLVPVIILIMQGFFVLIPKIDPLKNNIETFRKEFEGFALTFALCMAYLFALIVLWNINVRFDMNRAIAVMLAGVLYGTGTLLKKTRRNWFIGIRTPWTLSSDHVWNKTHAIGGELFKLSGLIALLGVIIPRYAIELILIPIMASSLGVVLYSYWLFKKQK